MQVSEVMHKGIVSVQISDSLKKVANLMKEQDIGSVPVYKNARPVGFVTDRDIVITCVAKGKPPEEPISLAMTNDLVTIQENQDITLASKIMREKQISRLLVVDKGEQPVGMLSLHDLASNLDDDEMNSEMLRAIKGH